MNFEQQGTHLKGVNAIWDGPDRLLQQVDLRAHLPGPVDLDAQRTAPALRLVEPQHEPLPVLSALERAETDVRASEPQRLPSGLAGAGNRQGRQRPVEVLGLRHHSPFHHTALMGQQ